MQTKTGGCLCGAVRYSVPWPPLALATCSCVNCQKQSGAVMSAVGVVARNDLTLSGELKIFTDKADSGNAVYRQFCPNCGSPVLTDTEAARAGGVIFFKAGTLDKTQDIEPNLHYWAKSAQKWFTFPAEHTVLDEQ